MGTGGIVAGTGEAGGVMGDGGVIAPDADSDSLPTGADAHWDALPTCGVAGLACCPLEFPYLPLPYYCYPIGTVCADNEGTVGAISLEPYETIMCRPCGALGELACSNPRPGFYTTYWCNCGLVSTLIEGSLGHGKYVCLNPQPASPFPPGNGDFCTIPE
jgi:hypothetical protein